MSLRPLQVCEFHDQAYHELLLQPASEAGPHSSGTSLETGKTLTVLPTAAQTIQTGIFATASLGQCAWRATVGITRYQDEVQELDGMWVFKDAKKSFATVQAVDIARTDSAAALPFSVSAAKPRSTAGLSL